jgi:hypothetical protein
MVEAEAVIVTGSAEVVAVIVEAEAVIVTVEAGGAELKWQTNWHR